MPPAQASTAIGTAGAGAVAFEVCDGLHCVVGQLNTRIYPSGLGFDVVEFDCTITASATGASATVNTCNVGGVNAKVLPLSAPGSIVGTAGVGTFKAGSIVNACVGGSAVFVEQLIGGSPVGGSSCQDIIAISV
jgi:hypothetical protein